MASCEKINAVANHPTTTPIKAGTTQFALHGGLVRTSSKTSDGVANTLKMRELSDVFVAICSGVSIGKVGGELSIIVMVREP
jgi:hypothetical protein